MGINRQVAEASDSMTVRQGPILSEGLAAVKIGKKWHVDHAGQLVIPLQFDDAKRLPQQVRSSKRESGFGSTRLAEPLLNQRSI